MPEGYGTLKVNITEKYPDKAAETRTVTETNCTEEDL